MPINPRSTLILVAPVLLEGTLKRLVRTHLPPAPVTFTGPSDNIIFKRAQIWKKIISPKQGILHPRIYAVADVMLSLTSTVTGPIRTMFRVVGATICLLMHLFRADVTMMLDRSFYPLDPVRCKPVEQHFHRLCHSRIGGCGCVPQHFTSSTALLTALRVQYEFHKIRRMRPAGVSMSHLGIVQGDGTGDGPGASSNTENPVHQAKAGAAAVATVAAADTLEQGLMAVGGDL